MWITDQLMRFAKEVARRAVSGAEWVVAALRRSVRRDQDWVDDGIEGLRDWLTEGLKRSVEDGVRHWFAKFRDWLLARTLAAVA